MYEFVAELTGTMLLVLLGCNVVANVVLSKTKGNGGGWIVITVGWALAVFAGVTVAAPYSGAHLNPAVTLTLALTGSFPWQSVATFIAAQLAGALLGASIVWVFYYQHFNETSDADLKLIVFCTAPAIKNTALNFFSEAVGTFVLVYAVLHMIQPEINNADGTVVKVGMGSLRAVPVTLIVLAVGLSLGRTTGYVINPARDFSPRIIHALVSISGKRNGNWGYARIPLVAPFCGAAIAVALTLFVG
jgi:glycerol uptake facilitator protein